MDITTLSLAKKYANKVAAGFSKVEVQGNNLIFTLNDGTKATMTVPTPEKGSDGISIVDVSIDIDGSLLCHMSDGSTINAGKIAEYDEHSQELNNKIVSTRNELERVKNDVLETGTATDTFVHLEDSAMAEYQELSVDGVCEQETTEGKNLYNVFDEIKSRTKYTTVDNDGWITMKYDNTNGTQIIFPYYSTHNLDLNVNTQYALMVEIKELSGNFAAEFATTHADSQNATNIYIRSNHLSVGTKKYLITTKNSFEGTSEGLRTVISVNAGATGKIVFRMSVLADTAVTTDNFVYEPYTGNQPSPSSDYPQEIEVGRGKNLLSEKTETTTNAYFYRNNGFKVKAGTTYTLSCDTTFAGLYVVKKDDNTNLFVAYNKTLLTFTPTEDTLVYFNFYFTGDKATQYQLEKGSVATSYLPYNTIEIKSTGKNLFDENQLLQAKGWTYSNGYYNGLVDKYYAAFRYGFNFNTTFEENTQYTIKLNAYTTGGTPRFKIEYTDGTNHMMNFSATTPTDYSYTTTNGKTISKIVGEYGKGGSQTLYLKDIQIEKGSTATDYEPYKESSITVNLPEGEFIGKISDTIKDTLKVEYNEDDGQHHLKLYKNVVKVVLDGSVGGYNSTSNWFYASFTSLGITPKLLNYKNTFISDYFIGTDLRTDKNINGISFTGTTSLIIRNSDLTTLDEYKAWLSTNKPEVYYTLAEPYEIDLGIVDMPITYNEITNLFTDSNLSLTINAKYYRNFISTIQNLQVNEKALKQELIDINTRLSALETAQTNVASESEVTE